MFVFSRKKFDFSLRYATLFLHKKLIKKIN